jgi:hypothetical protein
MEGYPNVFSRESFTHVFVFGSRTVQVNFWGREKTDV